MAAFTVKLKRLPAQLLNRVLCKRIQTTRIQHITGPFLFFLGRRRITIGVPTAAFKFKGALRHDFLGLAVALGALAVVRAHSNKIFETVSALTLKFVYRHNPFTPWRPIQRAFFYPI
jgi:hypothetical protein